MRRFVFVMAIGLILGLNSCVEVSDSYSKMAPGIWRATLNLDSGKMVSLDAADEENNVSQKDISASELPFNFEVSYDQNDQLEIHIINGEERIKVDEVYFGRDKSTAKDTILMEFKVFDSYIKAIVEERVMEGEWHVNNRENYSIPIVARFGQDYRFTQLRKDPKLNLTGKWECTFSVDTENEYKAIGEFKQDGNELRGTFITETGDYRFLEGTVQENKVYLSVFDGAHAFLFEARILEDESLVGIFRSGKHYETIWEARRNDDFELTDAHDLTFIKDGFDRFNFSFPAPNGNMISLDHPEYKGKPTIVQILGTWCPNCWDETRFLVDYLKNAPSELKVIGIAFEKHKEQAKAMQAIRTYKDRLNVPYEIVWGGSYNKAEASKALPMLNKIISYPTMIFIDSSGNVKHIHTGFTGPATSEYANFLKSFEENVKSISHIQ